LSGKQHVYVLIRTTVLTVCVRCILTAVLGMFTVAWYSSGSQLSDEEMEREVRAELEKKESRKRKFLGLLPTSRSSKTRED